METKYLAIANRYYNHIVIFRKNVSQLLFYSYYSYYLFRKFYFTVIKLCSKLNEIIYNLLLLNVIIVNLQYMAVTKQEGVGRWDIASQTAASDLL